MSMTNLFHERRTNRRYLPKPVDKQLLIKVLQDATRSPSWANSQPWEVYVAAGEPLEQLKEAYVASFEKDEPRNFEMEVPKEWPEYLQQRMKNAYAASFKSMGIARDDEARRRENWKHNYKFFEAPVAIFLCMDASLSEWSLLDLGIFANSLMLAAKANGLDSTPAASSVAYPHHIRRILNIPDQQRIIVGIMLGYGDYDHPFNQYRSDRVPLEEVVHFRGI